MPPRRIQAPPVVEPAAALAEHPVEETPGPGHNEPPPEDPVEELQIELASQNTDLARRILDLEEAVLGVRDEHGALIKAPRFPAKIVNQDGEDKAIEMVRILQGADSMAKDRHKTAKAPWLARGRAVDGYFGRLRERVEIVRRKVQDVLDERMRAKRDAAREEEEKRVAARGYEQAPPPSSTADLTRTRSSRGAVATLSERWDFEVVNPADVPREYCSPDPQKIRLAVAAGKRDPEIPGVRIYDASKTRVR
jgi:hypothetical protein